MQILAIELENTKSYDSAKIEFTRGVNAIVGHNGAGKSTILEGIGLAVFDALEYRHADFVRGGARYAEVRVTILSSLDERPYQVVRRVGSSNQHFVYDTDAQMKVCEGKADVLRFLRKHLGVDPNADLAALFRDAVGVPQGTFTAAFLLTPEKRKGVFDSLLQVEEYKKAYEKLLEPIKTLRDRRQAVEVEIAGIRGRLERWPELKAALAQRQAEIVAGENKLKQAKDDLGATVQARQAWEAVRDEVSGLQKRQAQVLQRLKGAEAQRASAQQGLAEAQEAAAVVAKHQADHDRYVQVQGEQRRLEDRFAARQQVEAKRSQADKALALAEAETAQAHADLDLIAKAEADAAELAPRVSEQGELERMLEEVGQQQARLRDAEAAAAEKRHDVKALDIHHASLAASLSRAPEVEARQKGAQAEIDTARQVRDELAARRVEAETEAKALKAQKAALAEAETALCPVCEQPLTPEHRHELLGRNDARLVELRSQYGQALQAGREQEDCLKQAEAALAQIEQELRRLPRREEAAKAEQDLAAARAALQLLEGQVAQLAATAGQADLLQQALQALGDPRRAYTLAMDHSGRRAAVERRGQEAQAQLARLQDVLAALAAALQDYAGLDEEIAAVKAEAQRTQPAYEAVLANRRLAATVEDRVTDAAARTADLEQAQQEAAQVAGQLVDAEGRYDEAAYHAAVQREQELRGVLGALNAQLDMLARDQKHDEAEVEALAAIRSTLSEREGRCVALKGQEEGLEAIRNLLHQAGPYITKVLIRQVSENARQIYSEIMQDYARHLTWHEDYGVTLEVDGHERQFAQLSGGEQMTAALAVRLALLRELSNIDVAFFDEPTANLDELRRDALARQILQVKGFRQLFVISHDDTFEQATQNLIRVERDGGTSRIEYG